MRESQEAKLGRRESKEDRSTAELMRSFYGFLVAGRPKDEALRLAQVEMLRHPEWRHPFYWAAFQAAGDWR